MVTSGRNDAVAVTVASSDNAGPKRYSQEEVLDYVDQLEAESIARSMEDEDQDADNVSTPRKPQRPQPDSDGLSSVAKTGQQQKDKINGKTKSGSGGVSKKMKAATKETTTKAASKTTEPKGKGTKLSGKKSVSSSTSGPDEDTMKAIKKRAKEGKNPKLSSDVTTTYKSKSRSVSSKNSAAMKKKNRDIDSDVITTLNTTSSVEPVGVVVTTSNVRQQSIGTTTSSLTSPSLDFAQSTALSSVASTVVTSDSTDSAFDSTTSQTTTSKKKKKRPKKNSSTTTTASSAASATKKKRGSSERKKQKGKASKNLAGAGSPLDETAATAISRSVMSDDDGDDDSIVGDEQSNQPGAIHVRPSRSNTDAEEEFDEEELAPLEAAVDLRTTMSTSHQTEGLASTVPIVATLVEDRVDENPTSTDNGPIIATVSTSSSFWKSRTFKVLMTVVILLIIVIIIIIALQSRPSSQSSNIDTVPPSSASADTTDATANPTTSTINPTNPDDGLTIPDNDQTFDTFSPTYTFSPALPFPGDGTGLPGDEPFLPIDDINVFGECTPDTLLELFGVPFCEGQTTEGPVKFNRRDRGFVSDRFDFSGRDTLTVFASFVNNFGDFTLSSPEVWTESNNGIAYPVYSTAQCPGSEEEMFIERGEEFNIGFLVDIFGAPQGHNRLVFNLGSELGPISSASFVMTGYGMYCE